VRIEVAFGDRLLLGQPVCWDEILSCHCRLLWAHPRIVCRRSASRRRWHHGRGDL